MGNNTTKEDREFSRVDINIVATIQARGKETLTTKVRDISMKGLFVEGKVDWPIGTECEIHLILEGRNPPVEINVKGKVQRITEKGMGMSFTEVGLEAYEHLHNLVMLNTDDPEKVEQELNNHLGLKKK